MINVTNNQPFAINQPIHIRGLKADAASPQIQKRDDESIAVINVPANGAAKVSDPPVSNPKVTATPTDTGLALKAGDKDLGTLSWDIFFHKLDKAPTTDRAASETKREFDKSFEPMALAFKQTASGPLFHTFSAEASRQGMKLNVSIDVYDKGPSVVDIHTTFTNESAPQKNVYAAVLTRWQQPQGVNRAVNYDNHIAQLEEGGATPFRAGEGRHLMVQRGVDWINCSYNESGMIWMNDFTPSFTVHKEPTAKTPAHWGGANTAQLGQEAMVKNDAIYSITEIARPNIKSYASRLDSNVLPDKDQPLTITSRIIVSEQKQSHEDVDHAFIAYTGYRETKSEADSTTVTIGVPYTKFGTAYFPYSTLGENFEKLHLPGMSKETYWPLAADVVKNYKLFADDIRRDLRIAKAMGFETIRMHHLEMIDPLPREQQDAFLDFWFGELKHLGLTALIDVKLPSARVVELVKKYRPHIDGVEIDNEILIFGINDADVPVWKETYQAVKAVAPDMPVHLTAHTNSGAFIRLNKLGVPFDRLGEHAYMDSIDAIPSARDYALAMANLGTKLGKPPVITEWNWRFLTRMTDDNRAKIYPPIFENVLSTRCMPEIYQFQFQDSLAMAPHTLKGIRHYELLNVSRRPRPEAFEFMKLIEKYGPPTSPQRILKTEYQTADIAADKNEALSIDVKVTNNSDKAQKIKATAEGSSDLMLSIDGPSEFEMQPKQTATAKLKFIIPNCDRAPSGFYHAFVRFDAGDICSYAWIEVRKPGAPVIDKDPTANIYAVSYAPAAFDYDFNRPMCIVYGENAHGTEVEGAWCIHQTLESATGRPMPIYQENDLPKDHPPVIYVGTPTTLNKVKMELGLSSSSQPPARLITATGPAKAQKDYVIAGSTPDDAELAAMDFVTRYWKNAKDSASRRIPLSDKPIEKGPDPNALP